jgi:cell shape-determining protein MreC
MQLSRISARTWFWTLTFVLFLWTYLGTRFDVSFMRSAQGVIGHPVQTITIPGTWSVGFVQRGVVTVFRNIGASHYETETVASLDEKNKKLQDELAIKDGQIQQLLDQIKTYKGQVNIGLSPEYLREANIRGRSPGAGAATITIDRGSADDIKAGMPVIAGENHILGRVVDVGTKTATVRLITSPGYMVKAMITRHVGDKTVQLLKEPCLVKGEGNGQFMSDDIKVREANIEKGDIVQLMDREWPTKLQFFILGVVTEVGTNPRQMLRYEVRARANINDIQTVQVLVKY